jgi:hypothetical protein
VVGKLFVASSVTVKREREYIFHGCGKQCNDCKTNFFITIWTSKWEFRCQIKVVKYCSIANSREAKF